MEGTRLNKVNRQIQKDLGEIFLGLTPTIFPGGMITVTNVKVSPDLGIARVYLSLFPTQNRDEVFNAIEQQNKSIRHELAQRVGKQMRIVPELQFFIDDSLDYIENIERLLKK